MDKIDAISKAVVILIRLGVTLRVVYVLIQTAMYEEEKPNGFRRIRNAVVFLVIAEMIFQLKDIIVSYY